MEQKQMNNDKFTPPEPPGFGYSSAQNYPPPPSYSQHEYPPQGYPPQGYPLQGYAQPGQYPPQVYPPQGFPQQVFPPHAYPAQNFAPPPPQAAPQNYGPPPPQHFVPPPTQPPTQQNLIFVRPNGWYNRSRMNRPQSNVLTAATFIFITGGMNLAWSIGFRHNIYYNVSTHIKVAWFIGAIIGAAIAAFLPKVIPRRAITLFSSMLVLIGGIVNCTTHFNLDALTANLYLNGIANGLVFAPTLALAGELSVFYMRGKITTGTEQLSYNLGIFLQIAICSGYTNSYHYDDFNPERILGIISAFLAFLGLVFAAIRFIESPVFMVSMRREQAATEALCRLQRLFAPTDQTLVQLEEHKRYVAENESLTSEMCVSQAIPALIKLSLLRGLSAISISSFFFDMLYYANVNSHYWNQEHYIIYGVCRLLGSCIASMLVDSLGRKTPILVGLAGSTAFAFVAASQVCFGYKDTELWLFFFQFFAGITFTISSTYLAEAFPLRVKQHFISLTFIVELLVFIIIGASDLIVEFLYIYGGILAAAFFAAFICLPETKGTTLRRAQQQFGKYINQCFSSN